MPTTGGWLHLIPAVPRALLRRPGFATLAVATLAAGVAASSLAFALTHAALLAPLPFAEPERLTTVDVISRQGYPISLSIPNYRDWGERPSAFAGRGAFAGWRTILSGQGPAQVVDSAAIYGDVFATLGLRAAQGRLLTAADTEAGAPPVVVLGHGFWRQLDGDPGIVGRPLVLDGRPFTVVGVLPPGIGYPSAETAVYLGLGSQSDIPWEDRESGFGLRLLARLAPHATVERAQAELDAITAGLATAAGGAVDRPRLRPLAEHLVGDLRAPLALVIAAAALVVLLALANVGNLVLARAEQRLGELAIRQALGAGRGRLFRQHLAEAAWLSGTGSALGLLVATAALPRLTLALGDELPSFVAARLTFGPALLAFVATLALVLTAILALAPTLAVALPVGAAVQHGARSGSTRTSSRVRTALVTGQLALGTVLVAGTALLATSLDQLSRVERGFDARGVIAGRLAIPDGHVGDVDAYRALHDRLLERTRALPGVTQAAVALLVPLAPRSWEMTLFPDGVPVTKDGGDSVLFNIVSPDYFATLGVELVAGRLFTGADRDGGELVAVVDRSLAARFWPGQDPLGKRITFENEPAPAGDGAEGATRAVYRTIVGVVENLRHYELASPSRIQVYVPLAQTRGRFGMSLNLLARTDGNPTTLTAAMVRAVAEVDPAVPLSNLAPLAANVERALAQPRLLARAVAVLGALAAGLAGIGILALVSLSVTRRRRELGVRGALGATPATLVGLVLGEGLRCYLVGTVLGVALAVVGARLARGLLFGVGPLDVGAHLAAVLLLGTIVLVACAGPAWRAARLPPAEVLRSEA